MVGVSIACTHCPKTGTPTMSLPPAPARCAQRGQSWQKALLPHCSGLGHNTREKQACRFIPEPFCFRDTLLSQPDRMRNKYHQNTMREAILEVFIAQPHWRMFGCFPRQPILTVFPSQFLNFQALTQTESGLFEVCLSLFTRASCEGESGKGSRGQGCDGGEQSREVLESFACTTRESSSPTQSECPALLCPSQWSTSLYLTGFIIAKGFKKPLSP